MFHLVAIVKEDISGDYVSWQGSYSFNLPRQGGWLYINSVLLRRQALLTTVAQQLEDSNNTNIIIA